MAAAGRTIDNLHLRLSIVYVLVAFLYVGLLVDFYLTLRVLRLPDQTTLTPAYLESVNVEKDNTEGSENEPPLQEASPPNQRSSQRRKQATTTTLLLGASPYTAALRGHLRPFSKDPMTANKADIQAWMTPTEKKRKSGSGDEEEQDMDDKSMDDAEREEKTDPVQSRVKRRAWRRPRQFPAPEDGVPSVEFFPQPQTPQETDGYVWLTSYSRIPVEVLKEYCMSTKKYCPAGAPGPAGEPGNFPRRRYWFSAL